MTSQVAQRYRQFAEVEAEGVSATYVAWSRGVAEDEASLNLISNLPASKQQPNLVFAAARFAGAPVAAFPVFRDWLVEHWSGVADVIAAESTQTNEAGRCSVLLPVLSLLEGPLALIEAGTSAGLTLYPDRYSYRYAVQETSQLITLDPTDGPSAVVLPCSIDAVSVPTRLPDVVWRAGVDLNPIDVTDVDQLRWLEALIWPEHDERRARLHDAARIVAKDPPHLVAGDLLEKIPDLVAQAPSGSHVVVFHSAVLAYVAQKQRVEFAEMMRTMDGVTWVSNEGARVVPGVIEQVSTEVGGRFILAQDGVPVALTGPHGQSFEHL